MLTKPRLQGLEGDSDSKEKEILCKLSFPSGTSSPDRNTNFRLSHKEQSKKGQSQQPLGDSEMRVRLMERWKMHITFTSMPKIHRQLFSQVTRNSLEIFSPQSNSTRKNSLQGLARNEGIMRENVTALIRTRYRTPGRVRALLTLNPGRNSSLPFLSLKSKLLLVVLEGECPCEEIKT